MTRTNARKFSELTWAVAIGIDTYDSDYFQSLQSPGLDARSLAAALSHKDGCSIPDAQISLFVDSNTKRDDLLCGLEQVATGLAPDDVLIIFFAGHGLKDETDYYLCAKDTEPDRLQATAIGGRALESILAKSPARGILLILDCCGSAGFAEYAARFFSYLNAGEFRILLSASRSDEASWEMIGEKGTLFTKHLIRAVNGVDSISSKQGQIYFSELLRHIQDRVSEDLEKQYPTLPKQEPIFAGAYSRDPLLFVHKSLTLEQVALNTSQYSRAYLRRLILRLAVSVSVIILFAFGLFYTLLDHSEYLVPEGNSIGLYLGHPDYNALGFPKKLWSFDLRAEYAKSESSLRHGEPLIGALGRSALPLLMDNMQPEHRARLLLWQGDTNQARELARAVLREGATESSEPKSVAVNLLREIGTQEDIPALMELTKNPRSDIKAVALETLAKLDPASAMELSTSFRGVSGVDYQRVILRSLTAKDLPQAEPYIRDLMLWVDFHNITQEVLETSLRLGLAIPVEFLVETYERTPRQAFNADFGTYAALSGQKGFESHLIKKLEKKVQVSGGLTQHLTNLLALTPDRCPQVLWNYHNHEDEFVRSAVAKAIIKFCPSDIPKLREARRYDPYVIAELARNGQVDWPTVSKALDAAASDPDTTALVRLLKGVSRFKTAEAGDKVRPLLKRDEPEVMWEAVKTLRALGADSSAVIPMLDISWDKVSKEAYLWYADKHPHDAFVTLRKRLSEPNSSFEEILVRINLSKSELDDLKKLINGSQRESEVACSVLAMRGEPDYVVSLLISPDVKIRKTAASYVAFNPKHDIILKQLNADREHLDENRLFIAEQFRIKDQIARQLSSCPDWAKLWLVEASERLYSRRIDAGLALWIENLKIQFEQDKL